MATYADLIADALLDLGVLGEGEAPSAAGQAAGKRAMNRMLDSWAAERLRIYTVTRTEWTIVSGTGSYTVGSAGDVAVARPASRDHIVAVNYQDTSGTYDDEQPMDRHTEASWAAINQKDQQSTYPASWYYNPTYANGTLKLYPVPTGSTLEGVMYSYVPVSQVTTLSDSVSLPPSYERAIVKTLALELAPSYGKQPNPLLIEQARDATAVMKRANTRLADLRFEAAALIGGGERYDIYSG